MIRFIVVMVCVGVSCAMLQVTGCATNSVDGDDQQRQSAKRELAAPPGDVFYAMLGLSRHDYQPLSDAEMTKASEHIVRGVPVSLTDGMKISRPGRHNENALNTMVVKVALNERVPGMGAFVYVEFIYGAALDISAYAKALPSEEWKMYLTPATWRASDSVKYLHSGRGVPVGEKLYRLVTPQGLAVFRGGEEVRPLEDSHSYLGKPVVLKQQSALADAGTTKGAK